MQSIAWTHAELVMIDMASDPAVTVGEADFPVRIVPLASQRLPLAQARNLALRHPPQPV
ncbi:hypothetical protein [Blastomonas sp. AAP53]|uniref:hypothetical protein n=1 Tax=Blastomonas sp. AAP53 TaxID=1248760 RepID=UPI0002F6AD3C|nr:hypothetical protein [Blastomonas sp. AAP53]